MQIVSDTCKVTIIVDVLDLSIVFSSVGQSAIVTHD